MKEKRCAHDQKGGQAFITEAIESCDGDNDSIWTEKQTQLRRSFLQMCCGEKSSRICETLGFSRLFTGTFDGGERLPNIFELKLNRFGGKTLRKGGFEEGKLSHKGKEGPRWQQVQTQRTLVIG
jgi:hypothetical protein